MAQSNVTADYIMKAGPAKKLKLNADLQYLYDYERDDTSTTELVNQAQQLQVPYYDGDKWDSKYNLLEPKELQRFASNIYNNYKTKPGEIELECSWKLLYCVRGTVLYGQSAGFYGELYFNSEKHCLLLAIKGTSSWGNKWSDIKNVGLQFEGGEIDSAFTFGEKVRELIMKFKCKPMLMITGHSLGGYLAQIITYTLKYCYLDEDGSSKSRETPCDDLKIYTVVFDSPAALKQIIKLNQRDPIRPEILLLPIVNFIVDVNIINSNSVVGPHLGQVVAVKSFQDLNAPNKWKRIMDAKSFHGIKNFENINIEEFYQVKYLPDKKSITYDARAIPSCMFSVLNFERLHKYLFLADMCAELTNKLPKFNLSCSHMVIEVETVSIEEFIPRVHHFLAQYKDLLDSGIFNGKQIVDMVAFYLWRVGMIKDAHDLSLNEEWKQKIDQWQDGTKIGGFDSHEEMRFVGCLLHNTIPRCVHYNYEDFISFDYEVKNNFLATTKGVLVLIVKDENQINKQLYEKTKEVKIIYLILGSVENSNLNLLKFCALDEESQDKLRNKKVEFMGNEVCATLVYGNTFLENLQVLSSYNFHVESALKDELIYCDQSIASADGKSKFKSATEFAHELSKGKLKFVLISSEAGMGKSTALKQIAKTLQNHLQNYWIVHLNLFDIKPDLYEAKSILNTKAEATEFIRTAVLAERIEDEVLKKVFDWKVEAKEMIFLLDSLDEICPSYRDTATKLLALLEETEIQIVLTTRPHEVKNLKDAEIYKLVRFNSIDERKTFILQKFNKMNKQPPLDTENWLKKVSGSYYNEEFWSVPLTLNILTNIYDPTEDSEALSEKDIFEIFFIKSISNTLEIKLNKSQTSGFENFELYNELIQILAYCTIFHGGNVTQEFQQKIEDNCIFINRFDLAKVDDCNKVAFLHRSFAEHIVAKLFVQNCQEKFHKKILLDEHLKSILLNTEFSDIRKHICTIRALNPIILTSASFHFINGEDKLLLSILIEEDRYELYLLLKHHLNSQLNETMKVHIENEDVELYPLYFALIKARQVFAQQLVHDGAKFEAILLEKYVLHLAIEKGFYQEVINHFEKLKSKINEKNHYSSQTPLQIAVANKSENMVTFLIERGADVNFESIYSFSALICAIEANSAELVKLLIAKKADTTEALEWAALLNRKELFDIIFENYTPQEFKVERLSKCLDVAVYYGHLEIFKHFCDFPEASQREDEENGDTFLHIAALRGHLNCMQFIFEYQQQSIDIKNADGWTPLMIACYNGNIEIVEWLLNKNADVNAVDDEGKSCLHLGVQHGNKHIVEILVDAGADINLKDKKGWTPLFYVFGVENEEKRKDMEDYLLQNSADESLRDNEGNTCFHFKIKSKW